MSEQQFADGAHVAILSRPGETGVVVVLVTGRRINQATNIYAVQPDDGGAPFLVAEAGLAPVEAAPAAPAADAPAQQTPAELEAEAAALLARAQSETAQEQ